MAAPTVVVMPGDGIGRAVLSEALRVLRAVGFEGEFVHADIGWECWVKQGNPLPQATLALLEQHKLGLLGAVTSKPKEQAERELSPALRGQSLRYYSPIVAMRQHFDLDVCIRPCLSYPGNPLNFVCHGAGGYLEEPTINVVVFRQNTEGLYSGVAWTDPPDELRRSLATHPRFAMFDDVASEDLAIDSRIFSRTRCRRIVDAAFAYAERHGYASVSLCEKPNVLQETSGMMAREAAEVCKLYPSIEFRSTNVDVQMMLLTRRPEEVGVLVAGNAFGDIVSDAYAGLVGGLGFAASGNLGREVAVFEPTHGSAPKYADLEPSIVNPLATILSAAMLLDHVGEQTMAAGIRSAVSSVVLGGEVRTFDMLRLPGGPEALAAGAASTTQMADAVIAALPGPVC
jgi:isocitrate dehydrogenase (NAD+)